MDRLSVTEAANRLGITTEAIRQRIRRGTIDYDHDDGRYYVYLQPDNTQHKEVHNTIHKALLERAEKENEFLRRELERKDAILMTMAQRIPELEPAPSEAPAAGEAEEVPSEEHRPWWRRWFSP